MRGSSLLLLLIVPLLIACVPIQSVTPTPANADSAAPTSGATPDATAQPTSEEADPTGPLTPKAALERLFSGAPVDEEWFIDEFISQVPIPQIEAILTQVDQQLGGLVRIERDNSPYTLVFELGAIVTEIALDADGRIAGLFFQAPTLNIADLDEAVSLVRELPGDVSLLITKNGDEVVAFNADEPLAVGSAFKLAVLLELRNQIEAGEHAWDEVLLLEPQWKSLPSGLIQDWPDESPLTLHTLATFMISISDNTATDALIHVAGREAIEAITPRNRPFLTTQELFKLKATPNAELLARYRTGDETGKRQVLEELASLPLPDFQELISQPILDIEWFLSATELCDLMAQVQDLSLMTVSPGVAQPEQWARVAFKGGSEAGVYNLTSWLESKEGDSYCVTLTQNSADAPTKEEEIVTLYGSLLSKLE